MSKRVYKVALKYTGVRPERTPERTVVLVAASSKVDAAAIATKGTHSVSVERVWPAFPSGYDRARLQEGLRSKVKLSRQEWVE